MSMQYVNKNEFDANVVREQKKYQRSDLIDRSSTPAA
jgi:hypothetical protein